MAKRKKRKDIGLSSFAVLLFITLIIFFIGFFVGYGCAGKSEKTEPETVIQNAEPTTVDESPVGDPLIDEKISEMTLSEMVYQMMIISPEDITNVEKATIAGESTKKAIEAHPVGGLVYASKNFEDAAQTESLVKNSQSYSKIPLFIAIGDDGIDKYSEDEFKDFGFNLFLTEEFKNSDILDIGEVKIYKYKDSESLISSIQSGADIIYQPTNPKEAHKKIMKAIEDNEISEENIKASVKKILTLKLSKGILN